MRGVKLWLNTGLVICMLAGCYKPGHEHENQTPPEFDIWYKLDRVTGTIRGNLRDSTDTIYVSSIAKSGGISFEFVLTKGVPKGQDISCTLSGVPAGLTIVPPSFRCGLSYTWWPEITPHGVVPGNYPLRMTIVSPTYGTEMFDLVLAVR